MNFSFSGASPKGDGQGGITKIEGLREGCQSHAGMRHYFSNEKARSTEKSVERCEQRPPQAAGG